MVERVPRASSRDQILRVFSEHVAERGYADTSIGDIAAQLRLSKGTIVHHFGNKQTLLGELHVAYFARRFAEIDFVHTRLDDPVRRLIAMIYALLAAHRDDRAASLACMRELVRYFEGDLNDYVHAQRTRYTQLLVDILREGVHDGSFHVPDSRITALQIFGMCNYAWTWYRPDGTEPIEDIARLFVQNILNGIMVEPGDKDKLAGLTTDAFRTVRNAPGRLPNTPRETSQCEQ